MIRGRALLALSVWVAATLGPPLGTTASGSIPEPPAILRQTANPPVPEDGGGSMPQVWANPTNTHGGFAVGVNDATGKQAVATATPAASGNPSGATSNGPLGGSSSGGSGSGNTTGSAGTPTKNRTAPPGQAAIPNGQVATIGFRYNQSSTPQQILDELNYQRILLNRKYPEHQGPGYEQDSTFIYGTAGGQYLLAVLHQVGLFLPPEDPTNTPGPATANDQLQDTPTEVREAITTWSHQSQVATPHPHVQAGRAIPGLLTYLETGMTLTTNEVITSPLGPLTINGTATLTIDWGDGEITTGITNPGGPYPDGQLTHHYPNSGDYDITVTATWIINYELAGTVGVIPLVTTGSLPQFPVRALRAVARPV